MGAANLNKKHYPLNNEDTLVVEKMQDDLLSEYFNVYIIDTDNNVDWIMQPKNNRGIKVRDYLILEDNYIFAGYTYSNNFRILNTFIIKMDKDGSIIWNRKYSTSNIEVPNKIYRMNSGEFLLVGYSTNIKGKKYSQVNSNIFVQKCSPKGEKIWIKKIGDSAVDQEAITAEILDNSDIIIAGTEESSNINIIRLASDGEVQWRTNRSTQNDIEKISLTTNNNNIIVESKVKNNSNEKNNILSTYALKLNQYGKVLAQDYDQDFHLADKNQEDNQFPEQGLITSSEVRVRNRPTLEALVVGKVYQNSKVKILNRSEEQYKINDMNNYWYKLQLDSSKGWVYGEFIEFEK